MEGATRTDAVKNHAKVRGKVNNNVLGSEAETAASDIHREDTDNSDWEENEFHTLAEQTQRREALKKQEADIRKLRKTVDKQKRWLAGINRKDEKQKEKEENKKNKIKTFKKIEGTPKTNKI
jgi:hypothetical protein